MVEDHIKFGFVKTKTIDQLKAEFLNIPTDLIQSIETEYRSECGNALLKEAQIENFIGNALKAILLAALTIIFLIIIKWYFTPFTFGKIFSGLLLGIFIGLPTFLMSFICYLIVVLIISGIIKHVFFNKQTKFLDKLRKIKADIDSEKRYQEKLLEIEKQKIIKNKSDSIFRDTEIIRRHFTHKDHTHLLSDSALENTVDDIFNKVIESAVYEATRKDRTKIDKNKEIEKFRKFLFLLAHVAQEELVEKVNKFEKLTSLVNPDDPNLDFSKTLLMEIAKLTNDDPRLLSFAADALRRYENFSNILDIELKTKST